MNTVFDADQLMASLGDDGELAAELVTAFLEDSPERRDSLRESLDAGDAGQTAKLAHSLKGMCGVVRCNGLSNLALSMETAGRDGNMDRAKTLFEEFDGLLATAHDEMRRFLETM